MKRCLAWLIPPMLVSPHAFSCDNSERYVAIPIEIGFANAQYRQDWIYRSFQPYLDIGSVSAQRKQEWIYTYSSPDNEHVSNGLMTVVFCVPGASLGRVSRLELHLASKTMSLVPRPIQWSGPSHRRVGAMSLISVLDQPDPDWVAIQSVRVIDEVSQKARLLEITVTNFSSFESSHAGIVLSAGGNRIPNFSCLESTPRFQDTFLDLAQTTSLSAGENSWTMLGDHKVEVKVNLVSRCGYTEELKAVIPIQLQIPARSSARIVLRLLAGKESRSRHSLLSRNYVSAQGEIGSTVQSGEDARELSTDELGKWWERWPSMNIVLTGTASFPDHVEVDER